MTPPKPPTTPPPGIHRAVHPRPRARALSSDRPQGWSVVLPLKGGPRAKSRLGGPSRLARAIALDCLDAVLAASAVVDVVVVTTDPDLSTRAGAAGARIRPESIPGSGLGAAITDGLAAVAGPCAVLLGDLPALRPDDLTAALERAAEGLSAEPGPPEMVFVPDAEGTGTVLLAALDPAAMRPAFGPGSAAAHRAAGAVPLGLDRPRLRRDVDTPADLRAALALGVGPRTGQVLAELSTLIDNLA